MRLVKRLQHLKIDHGEIAEEKRTKESVGALGHGHDGQAPRDQKRNDMAPARARASGREREQDLGRLAAVQRPDRQQVERLQIRLI